MRIGRPARTLETKLIGDELKVAAIPNAARITRKRSVVRWRSRARAKGLGRVNNLCLAVNPKVESFGWKSHASAINGS